jgi:hypothetical protein
MRQAPLAFARDGLRAPAGAQQILPSAAGIAKTEIVARRGAAAAH